MAFSGLVCKRCNIYDAIKQSTINGLCPIFTNKNMGSICAPDSFLLGKYLGGIGLVIWWEYVAFKDYKLLS